MPISMPRKIYADMYGPTTGDKVRLADTELFIEVETDLTNASQHLSKENSFHMDLQNFIQDYLKSRYAIKGKNPAELISELNKIYRRRKP